MLKLRLMEVKNHTRPKINWNIRIIGEFCKHRHDINQFTHLLAHSKANFCGRDALDTSAHLIIILFTKTTFSGDDSAVVSSASGSCCKRLNSEFNIKHMKRLLVPDFTMRVCKMWVGIASNFLVILCKCENLSLYYVVDKMLIKYNT